jgi:hypothetical protein
MATARRCPAHCFERAGACLVLTATAVPQLLYPETTAAKWLFPQEKATSHGAGKDTLIVEPLWNWLHKSGFKRARLQTRHQPPTQIEINQRGASRAKILVS